jgi:hypothetical protein
MVPKTSHKGVWQLGTPNPISKKQACKKPSTIASKPSAASFYSMYGFSSLNVSEVFGNGSRHTCNIHGVSKTFTIANSLISRGKRHNEYYMAMTFKTTVTEEEAAEIGTGFYTSEVEQHSEAACALVAFIMCHPVIYGMYCRRMASHDDIFRILQQRQLTQIERLNARFVTLPEQHWAKKYFSDILGLYDNGLHNKIRREPTEVMRYMESFQTFMLSEGFS